MLNSFARTCRTVARRMRDQIEHDRLFDDPRLVADHVVANRRVRDHGGAGCPFCSD